MNRFCFTLFGSYFLSSSCRAPSLMREWASNLQCSHALVRVKQYPYSYITVSSETPPTWRPRFPMNSVVQPKVKVKSQCHISVGQLSICSGTKENHVKPWSSWPITGPSACKLTSSQQFRIKYASPNISPYLCWSPPPLFFYKWFFFSFFFKYCYVRKIWISAKPCITPAEGMNAYMNKYTYICILWLSVNLVVVGWKNWMLYEVCCSQLRSDSPVEL
jgi:hypothetical protein